MTRRLLLSAMAPAAASAQRTFNEIARPKEAPRAGIVEVSRIGGKANHNAFTDLVRFRERWYCVYREASTHVSNDGAIRVLSSPDASSWVTSARLDYPVADLRDPKICVTPDNQLLLSAAAAMHPPADYKHKTLVWHSKDGRDWSPAEEIGEHDFWLWRLHWHRNRAFALGYSTTGERVLRSYVSQDGVHYDVLNPKVLDQAYPNETSIVFLPDESALCLLRRDEGAKTALLGRSRPPYRGWTWQDLGMRIGGPHMIRLPDGRLVAAVRLYEGAARTSLCWLEPSLPALTEFLVLPSGGDTSYAGLVFHDGLLYVSYYSSHEEKTAVYLAKVKLPPRA